MNKLKITKCTNFGEHTNQLLARIMKDGVCIKEQFFMNAKNAESWGRKQLTKLKKGERKCMLGLN